MRAFMFIHGILLCSLCLGSCSNPEDIDTKRLQHTSFVDTGLDDPRFDTLTAIVDAQIRFEAVIDTTRVQFRRFAGTGLRIGLVAVMPDSTEGKPLRQLTTLSANYLDVPATALPLRVSIPAEYFRRYIGARLATAFVVLFLDANANEVFDSAEPVYGASEQHLFAWAEGRVERIPALQYGDLRVSANKLVRIGNELIPRFKATPDYASSIFIIHVRGPEYRYALPWPWPSQGMWQ